MNKKKLHELFDNYIKRFDYINDDEHQEYYKWQICKEFPRMMKEVLEADDATFSDKLYGVKRLTQNFIDSYTQPIGGLVVFSRELGVTPIREMLKALYADDGGNLDIRMEIIRDFLERWNELLEQYENMHGKKSFMYKATAHTVSALLFLNDPDNHYMYKANQANWFADCVEYYDDWGVGNNINLAAYHKMCDELVNEIWEYKTLLDTDASRFDGRLKLLGGELHPDKAKHILAFDIIYCSGVYNLYDGIPFVKRNSKEKNLYLENQKKARELKEKCDEACAENKKLEEAIDCFTQLISAGDEIKHRKYGVGIVQEVSRDYLTAEFDGEKVKVGLALVLANSIVTMDKKGFSEAIAEYKDVLGGYTKIPRRLESLAEQYAKYEEYLL